MKDFLKKIPLVTSSVRFLRNIMGVTPDILKLNYFKEKRDRDIQNYLQNNSVKKLQIGCQNHPIPGWLNADINPMHEEVILMDATQSFPFEDNTFDAVFSEHMIEHITFSEGVFMVKECYSILKPGGTIRLSTPDIKFLIDLYREPKSEIQQKYIEFSNRYFKDNRPLSDTVVINNFFKDWGHQFIYDFKTLEYILQQAGFTDIIACEVYKSEHEHFQQLEKHALELGEEFNRLESVIIEATK